LDNLDAPHLIVSTCFGISPSMEGAGLALASISPGRRSFVSTVGVKRDHPAELPFYRALLMAGFSLGESVAYLNAFSERTGVGGASYRLLGDPEERLPGTGAPVPAELLLAPAGPRKWWGQVSVRPDMATVYAIREPAVVDAVIAGRDVAATLQFVGKQAQPFYHFGRNPDGPGALFFVFGPCEVPCADATVEIRLEPVVTEEDLACLQRFPEAVRELSLYKCVSPSLKGLVDHVHAQTTRLAAMLPQSTYDCAAVVEIESLTAIIRHEIHRCDMLTAQFIKEQIIRGTFNLTERYWHQFRWTGQQEAGSCPYCGAGVVAKRHHHVLQANFRRESVHCPACGVIGDGPFGAPLLRILGPERMARGETAEYRVAVDLWDAALAMAGVTMALENAKFPRQPWAPSVVATPVLDVVLERGRTAEVSFAVAAAAGAIPHRYFLKAVCVVNQELLYGARPIRIIP
ncbi:MAG: hypothetical protein M1553_14570, partial [Firmicutes bacterium]|nr:hypothetical protein [Bacillota bacterium]